MKYPSSHIVGLVALGQCLKVAMCRVNDSNNTIMAPSFIVTDNAVQQAGEMAGVVFAEMAHFQEDVMDAVAKSMLSFLETQGFNYEDPQHMNRLISFMEEVVEDTSAKSKAARFMDEMKKMARKTWHATKDTAKETAKHILLATLNGVLKESIRQSMPVLENINEKAFRSLPLNLRVALAPLAYKMWRHFFEKIKLDLPVGFKIENFVCKAIDKQKCDRLIKRVKDTWVVKSNEATTPEVEDKAVEEEEA